MERLIGKECSVGCTLSALANDHGLSMLVGKRLVVFGEVMKAPGNTGEIATERLVSIIGMDPQVINRKFGDIYSTTLPVKIVMACNEFPLFMNSRQALTNRMLVFPFTESFAGKEDPKLEERLHNELPGIINWAIVGAKKLLAGERLRAPKSADATILEIKRKMDSVLAFMMDCATVHEYDPWDSEYENLGTETLKAYEAYKEWCEQHGHSKKNMENFISSVLAYSEGNVAKERVRRAGSQVTVLCNFQVNFSQNFGFN
jgi:putative DNA primase/helicase